MSENKPAGSARTYAPPEFENEIRLQLSRNESAPVAGLLENSGSILSGESICRYPDRALLRHEIAGMHNVDPGRIVITAGGDDAIDRLMKIASADRSGPVVSHDPSFEMIDVYAESLERDVLKIDWMEGEFPAEKFCAAMTADTAIAIVVSPNNPTGAIVQTELWQQLATCGRETGTILLADLAYVEFADHDPTAELANLPGVAVVRTFSKAWGMAGLRIGYLIAPDEPLATRVRELPGPYPVSGVSIAMAARAIQDFGDPMQESVQFIRKIRSLLDSLIRIAGGIPLPSSANFILAEFEDAESIWNGLAAAGVGVRKFPDNPRLKNRLRITCPPTVAQFLNLTSALATVTQTDCEPVKTEVLALQFATQETPRSVGGSARQATSSRQTKETAIEIELNLDGTGKTEIETGIGFLDHMLTALAFHAGIDLKLKCDGDLVVDDHHTSEDCAIALGAAIHNALGERKGIRRFGFAYAPLDEALARTVIDLSGRPWPEIHLKLQREMVGAWACENITHFFQSFAIALRCSLHVDVLRGTNDHHKAEAAFKSLAKALKTALLRDSGGVPSTKGVLE